MDYWYKELFVCRTILESEREAANVIHACFPASPSRRSEFFALLSFPLVFVRRLQMILYPLRIVGLGNEALWRIEFSSGWLQKTWETLLEIMMVTCNATFLQGLNGVYLNGLILPYTDSAD